MTLSDEEKGLQNSLYWERSTLIRARYDQELHRLDYLDQPNKHAQYIQTIREYAREELAAWAGSYADAYRRIERYPQESDFEEIAEELRAMIPRFQDYFQRRHTGVFSPLPPEYVEQVLDVLQRSIGQMLGDAVGPIRVLVDEGEVDSARKAKSRRRGRVSLLKRSGVALLIGVTGGWILFSAQVRNSPWVQNHPNRLGLYASATTILLSLCWSIVDPPRRQLASVPLVIAVLAVILQLLGR